MQIGFLFLVGLVASKIVDLVQDPLMQNLVEWYSTPEYILCRQCSTVASVGPSAPGGYYFYEQASLMPYTYELWTNIELPAGVTNVNLSIAVQVGGGGLFSLAANFQEFNWGWSSWSLDSLAVGQYVNVSVIIGFASSSESQVVPLKFTIDSSSGQSDFLSINQVHLMADVHYVMSNNMKLLLVILSFVVIVMCIVGWCNCRQYLYRKFYDCYIGPSMSIQ
jgi:hypothetical protein